METTIRELLAKEDRDAIQAFCIESHPRSVVETITNEDLNDSEIWSFLEYNDIFTQATIFEYFPLEIQLQIIRDSNQDKIAHLFEQMSTDDRADLLRHIPKIVGDNLLRLVDDADRKDIAALVQHEPDTAGGIMSTSYAWLSSTITVGEAIERLRLQAPKTETIHHIFLLSEDRQIQGVIRLETLVVANVQEMVADLMRTEVIVAHVEEARNSVAIQMSKYDLSVIPVVDDFEHLVGIITIDDAIDVMQAQSTSAAYKQAAIGSMTENYLEANPFKVWRKRVGWLACLFIAELFTFTALASFESAIEKVVVLSLFVPLCISTGGNSGSQAATLITRAMALDHVKIGDWLRVLWHEMIMGIGLGVALGAIGFVRALCTPNSLLRGQAEWWQLSCAVGISVMVICMWGTIIGSMLPLVFRRLGFDPAFASSPFVATFVDVTGIMIYFTIASSLIPALH